MLLRALLFALVSACSYAQYNLCEAINGLANDWNDVANFVHEFGDQPLPEADFNALVNHVSELSADTYTLADALIDIGNDYETRLGTELRKTLTRMTDENAPTDEVVGNVDRLVDILDRVTDYCEED